MGSSSAARGANLQTICKPNSGPGRTVDAWSEGRLAALLQDEPEDRIRFVFVKPCPDRRPQSVLDSAAAEEHDREVASRQNRAGLGCLSLLAQPCHKALLVHSYTLNS